MQNDRNPFWEICDPRMMVDTGMRRSRVRSLSLILLMLLSSVSLLSMASAGDTDGDGIDDAVDDCPLAAGNSTVDRDGCPDRDGDGTSDKNDPWTIQAGGFLKDAEQLTNNNDYYAVFFNHDGSKYLTSDEDGWTRVWETATKTNLKSVQGSGIRDVGWSPDGVFVAVTTSSDQLHAFYSSNVTPLFSVSTAGEETYELEYSPDGTMIAVVGARDGGSGNGQVEIFNAMNGSLTHSFEPAGEDQFYSVDWSPDGSRILIGGDEDVWIYNTGDWSVNRSINTNRGTNNGVAWSPDGNSFATCEAWAGSGARVRLYDVANGQQSWSYSTSTSCNTVTFSPDSTQVAASMTYYQSDGASVLVFDADTGNTVDQMSGPRPGGCSSSGGGNNCGSVYGVDWHPNGVYIISAHGRDDEGIYHWIVDPDIDGDGVLNEDDAFPEDGTQWDDTDNDGYGDNPAPANEPDECPNVWGNSTEDRFGCPDSDGDGWSDLNDDYPDDGLQWSDSDGDGYPDNTDDSRDPNPYGGVDRLPNNPTQWDDTDGDGYGDNFANASWVGIRPTDWPGVLITMNAIELSDIDVFPINPDQWNDTDGDWVGDEPFTTRSDGCVDRWGDSVWDRLGCPDEDGDGWSDPDADWAACLGGNGEGDWKPLDPTQWCDSDGDGYGDNSSGTNGDACPGAAGNSTVDRAGCKDSDGDGWSDASDMFRNDPTQWSDRDGDRIDVFELVSSCGDNPNGNNPDLFPEDPTQCTDRDGDGYGDHASGPNGDWFPDDPTQWYDTDRDGYGDNPAGNDADLCPEEFGTMDDDDNRGCPDSDLDGVADNLDAFPYDPFKTVDRDGDGFADDPLAPERDDCPDEWGNSTRGSWYGCPDSDGDGWADSMDDFRADATQWKDSDEDGWGDNWGNTSWNGTRNSEWPGIFREDALMPDAFPLDDSQWNDTDGDGFGDNANGSNPDAFPLVPSQWKDSDGDGYGDNTTRDAFEPDDCRAKFGTSWRDRHGCEDSDGDGASDLGDVCMWDPDVWEPPGKCETTGPPSGIDSEGEGMSGMEMAKTAGAVVIVVLLLAILVAMISRQAAKRSGQLMRQNVELHEKLFDEEERRRDQWIDHYVASGDLEKAKELGWEEKAQWQIHEEEKVAAEEEKIESLPEALDIDDLLDD